LPILPRTEVCTAELKTGDLSGVVDVLRRLLKDWEVFVSSVEALTWGHEALKIRCRDMERERDDLRATQERLRHDLENTRQVLTNLRPNITRYSVNTRPGKRRSMNCVSRWSECDGRE
jgi:hypothetical protein